MSNLKLKLYQECEFCHKLVETNAGGLLTARLPMRHILTDGTEDGLTTEAVSICDTCAERLNAHLSKMLELKKIEDCGAVIHWLDDVMSEVTENEI